MTEDRQAAERMMVAACARLVALGRVDLAASLRIGASATLALGEITPTKGHPSSRALLLHVEGWGINQPVQVLKPEEPAAVVWHAWAARRFWRWEFDNKLVKWLGGPGVVAANDRAAQ